MSNKIFLLVFFAFVTQLTAQNNQKVRHNNLRKVAKIADMNSGNSHLYHDNPLDRINYENKMLVDPNTGIIPQDIRIKELAYVNSQKSGLQKTNSRSGINLKSAIWQNRGPFNVGGRTRALAIDVSNENIILAGGVSGGVWRSTNGGASWVKTTGASDLHSVTSLAQDPRPGNQNIWYYSSGEIVGNSASGAKNASFQGNGIYKSTNGGVTWSVLTFTASNTPHLFDSNMDYNWRVCVNPLNGHVYAACFGIIIKSADGGSTWSLSLNGGNNATFTDITCASNGVLYAVIDSQGNPQKGIFRSSDGITWTPITPSDFPANHERTVLCASVSNPNIVYFLSETPNAGKLGCSLYKYTYTPGIGNGNGSIGNGASWENRTANIPSFGGQVGDYNPQNSYNMVISVHPNNPNVVFIGGTNLYRSTDGFASSSNTSWIGGYSTANDISKYENHHADIHALAFYSGNSSKMLCGHDGGISLTNNNLSNINSTTPVSWTYLNNGYLTTQAYAVAIDQSKLNDSKLLAGFQDNGSWSVNSDNSSAAWFEEFSGDGGFCFFAKSGNERYVSAQRANIFKFVYNSAGQFIDWARVTPANIVDPSFICPYLIDPNNENVMYLADKDKIWRNKNLSQIPSQQGSSTSVNWELMNNTTVSGIVSALDISKNISGKLYYGTDQGKLYRLDNALVSNSAAIDISSSIIPAGGYVSCIKVDPSNADRVFVVVSNYGIKSVFYTENAGNTWVDISGNLEQNADGSGNGPSVRWIETLKIGNEYAYFVGTSTGIYATTALSGSTTVWTQQGSNAVGNVVVRMIKCREDGTVVAATHGNGIYSAKYSALDCPTPSQSNITKTVCDAFLSPAGKTYTVTGIYRDTIKNTLGCDSIVEINLTVNKKSQVTINPSVCKKYISPSGKIFSSSGTYTDILKNSSGCDSVITINLTVNKVDVTVKQNGNILTANNLSGSYKWLNCNSSYAVVPDETKATYSPKVNGKYAVEITQNGCVDTSLCFSVTKVGIEQNDFGADLKLFPNPSSGNFTIEMGNNFNDIQLIIRDIDGRVVEMKQFSKAKEIPVQLNASAGIYFVEISSGDNKVAIIKLLKE